MDQLLNFFVTRAYAESAAADTASQGGSFSFMVMMLIFFLFMYFVIWRPQNKRAREQQQLLSSIAKGDEVMTVSGTLGRINKITDQYVLLGIANNVEIVMQKSAVVSVLPKGTMKAIE